MSTNTKRGRKAFVVPEGVVVDWTQSNKAIATSITEKRILVNGKELKVSPLTILHLRKRLGVPPNRLGRRSVVVTPAVVVPTTTVTTD